MGPSGPGMGAGKCGCARGLRRPAAPRQAPLKIVSLRSQSHRTPFSPENPVSHLPQSLTMMSGHPIQGFFRLDPGQLTLWSHDTYWCREGGPLQ